MAAALPLAELREAAVVEAGDVVMAFENQALEELADVGLRSTEILFGG